MALSIALRMQAIREISKNLPEMKPKRARQIAEERLDDVVKIIQKSYVDDGLVTESMDKDTASYVRNCHLKLSLRILTSYPGVRKKTAQSIITELVTTS